MLQKTLPVGAEPGVSLEAAPGNLRVTGWERDEMLAKTDDDLLEIEQDGEQFSITCDGDLILNLPKGARLHIGRVEGDAVIRGLSGALDVLSVDGDLELRGVGAVKVGSVDDDLSLRGAAGEVQISSISGDASIEGVEGSLILDSVEDDLYLRGVHGNVKANVSGDAVLSLEPQPGQECSIAADDDILLRLPENVNATLQLDGDSVHVDVPGVSLEKDTSQYVVLGDGSAKISLHAGGDLVVTSREGEWESAAEFSSFDWGGFGRDLGEHISRRIQNVAVHATRQAEVAMHRADHKIRRAAHQSRRWNINWPVDQGVVAPPSQPVSDEERMAILRMLQEKKISAEEAEKLLAALE